jgi:hypothetical protein
MNNLLTSSVISVIYFLFKFLEMRFVLKENKPIKELTKDTFFVFLSVTVGLMVLEQFNLNEIVGNFKTVPSVFVSNPDF